jgi:signal peptidase I
MLEVLLVIGALACAPAAGLGMRVFSIPSGSMEPGLPLGSLAAAYRCAYGLSSFSYDGVKLPIAHRWPDLLPSRGDVIVFRTPSDPSIFFVKRVIGLPGDDVQLIQGRLILDGRTAAREALPNAKLPGEDGTAREVAAYRETLPGGASYPILMRDGDRGAYETTQIYRVPAGNVFVLGDNRDNSLDSRMPVTTGGVGFVPVELIFGKVVTVSAPSHTGGEQ